MKASDLIEWKKARNARVTIDLGIDDEFVLVTIIGAGNGKPQPIASAESTDLAEAVCWAQHDYDTQLVAAGEAVPS